MNIARTLICVIAAAMVSGCVEQQRREFAGQYSRLWNEKLGVEEISTIEDAIARKVAESGSGDDFLMYFHERMTPQELSSLRNKNHIIDFIEDSFDRVLNGVKSDVVEPGKVNIYYLYNLGYVFKTPTRTIGLDICHRRAEELVPYLDFTVVTHNHEDHRTERFLRAMNRAGKLVVSNFWSGSGAKIKYGPGPSDFWRGYSKEPYREIKMQDVTVRTYESDHLTYQWFKFNMPVELDLRTGDRECVIFSGGDSCDTMQLKCSTRPDIFIAHPRVGGDIVHGALLLDAKVTFISHLLEMQHGPSGRHPYSVGYSEKRLMQRNHLVSCVPHWGEKYVWPLELDEANNGNLHLPALSPRKPLRIMPVGDSITRGSIFRPVPNGFATKLAGGYRRPLQKILAAAGVEYQFVGELAYWAYGEMGDCDPDFQRYHHGLSGFSNKGILEGGKLPPPDLALICRSDDIPLRVPGIVESIRRWKPDVILLMSGANGFNDAARDSLVREIANNFSGDLFVATIPPQKPPRGGFEQVASYNSTLQGVLANLAKSKTKCRVHYVDINPALTQDDISGDGVHPNQSGLDKIAKVWGKAILDNLPAEKQTPAPVAEKTGKE
ncbi:MAG: hypothetical protein MJ025_07050 [Victivallaceae bacterium]|nr:hypothetical protein [Victivallaceae bacterium]